MGSRGVSSRECVVDTTERDGFGLAVADGVAALSKDMSLAKPEQLADSLRRIKLQPG